MSTAAEEGKFKYKEAGDAIPPQVCSLFQILDTDGKGYLSQQELKDLVAHHLQHPTRPTVGRTSEGMDSHIVKDLNLSGKRVTTADMTKVHKQFKQLQVEFAQDTRVSDDNTITVNGGETALTGSADTEVVNGMLVSRKDDEGVCSSGTGNCSRHALATRPAQEQRPLSSKIANEVFKSLDSITFSFSGDASSTMTFRISGFVRARSTRSEHGTVVHLQLHVGTLTLDGSNIFLGSSLHSYLESLGLVAVGGQQTRAHGRRLQASEALVTGFFSFFEEFEFEALSDTLEKPRSPSLPYHMTVLERKPCKSVDACKSKIFDGEFLPGYDATTNSIATRVEFVETETWTMSITR
eukprot:2565098-Amphidinium_carterae.1